MIPTIRLHSQQLINPVFNNPKDLVSWMGGIQAQDYTMSKWAIGIRLKAGNLQTVNEALAKGDILRIHVMRPTWHYVAAEDIRWMLKLSSRRIITANDSFAKSRGQDISVDIYNKANRLLEKALAGHNHLTKQEIDNIFKEGGLETNERLSNRFLIHAEAEGLICSGADKNNKITFALLDERVPPIQEIDNIFKEGGLETNERLSNRFLIHAEAEGLICSGADKNNKITFALLDERVPPIQELHKEEALAILARKYFRSHSPASLKDFVWWSGLSVTEARQGIAAIEQELLTDRFLAQKLYVHQSYKEEKTTDILHILPSYDEYLISYKDRTDVLNKEYQHKAFNSFGIFRPVILYNGQIVGNWNKVIQKQTTHIEMNWFKKNTKIKRELLSLAERKYLTFFSEL